MSTAEGEKESAALFFEQLTRNISRDEIASRAYKPPSLETRDALLTRAGGLYPLLQDPAGLAKDLAAGNAPLEKVLKDGIEELTAKIRQGGPMALSFYPSPEEWAAVWRPSIRPLAVPLFRVIQGLGFKGDIADLDRHLTTTIHLENLVRTYEAHLNDPHSLNLPEGVRVIFLYIKKITERQFFYIPRVTQPEMSDDEAVHVLMRLIGHLYHEKEVLSRHDIMARRYIDLKDWEFKPLNIEMQSMAKGGGDLPGGLDRMSQRYLLPRPETLRLFLAYAARQRLIHEPYTPMEEWSRTLTDKLARGSTPPLFHFDQNITFRVDHVVGRFTLLEYLDATCREKEDDAVRQRFAALQQSPAQQVSREEETWLLAWHRRLLQGEQRRRSEKRNAMIKLLTIDRAKAVRGLQSVPLDPDGFRRIAVLCDQWQMTYQDRQGQTALIGFEFVMRRLVPLWIMGMTGHFPYRVPPYIKQDCHHLLSAVKAVVNDPVKQLHVYAKLLKNHLEQEEMEGIFQTAKWLYEHSNDMKIDHQVVADCHRGIGNYLKHLQQCRAFNSPERDLRSDKNMQRLIFLIKTHDERLFRSDAVFADVDELYEERLVPLIKRVETYTRDVLSRMRKEERENLDSENGADSPPSTSMPAADDNAPASSNRRLECVSDLIELIVLIKTGENADALVRRFVGRYNQRPNDMDVFPKLLKRITAFIELTRRDPGVFAPDLRRFASYREAVDKLILVHLARHTENNTTRRFLLSISRSPASDWRRMMAALLPELFEQ